MKRKTQIKPDDKIDPTFFDPALFSLVEEKSKVVSKCSVCGGETTADSPELLCWVCRRLKISAWRDSEQQMPAQE